MRAIRRGTMKKACFLFIAMLLLSTNAMGQEPHQWLYDAIKKENPNQLAYFVGIDRGCPFTKETLNQIVEGVFIRSRIKPLKEDVFVSGRIYLHLYVRCVPLKNRTIILSFRLERILDALCQRLQLFLIMTLATLVSAQLTIYNRSSKGM